MRKEKKKNEKEDNDDTPKFTNPISQLFTGGVSATEQKNLIDGQKLINEWLSKKHLYMKTSLNQNQINSLTTLYGLGKQFKIQPLLNVLHSFIMFMISKNSESANQLVNILQSRGMMDSKDLEAISKFSK